MKFFLAAKPIGITPLELIKNLKKNYHELEDKKIGYAGRLDPMAEGLMLFLVGDENKNKSEYENLDKEYEFEVLFGMQTDSYDILGIPTISKNAVIEAKAGKFKQKYPPYSSATYKGKKLFYWARRGLIDKIDMPTKEVEIYSIKKLSNDKISASSVLEIIEARVKQVDGDFRQTEIIAAWRKLLSNSKEFSCSKYCVKCSSGTYVRSIANNMGGLALSIKRTTIGKHSLSNAKLEYEFKKDQNP